MSLPEKLHLYLMLPPLPKQGICKLAKKILLHKDKTIQFVERNEADYLF